MNLDIKSFIIGMLVIIVLLILMGFSGGLGSSPYNPVYVKIVQEIKMDFVINMFAVSIAIIILGFVVECIENWRES